MRAKSLKWNRGGSQRTAKLMACTMLAAGLAAVLGVASPSPAQADAETQTNVPRFASLKASRVNLRKGPGTDYPTAWVFQRAGLPVEIMQEHEAWRKVRDAEGTSGWVLRTLISGRRTAQILPWEVKGEGPRPQVEIRSRASESSRAVVLVEAGVIADVHDCDGAWCRISVEDYQGYVEQKKLWGVYAGEVVK